MAYPRKTPIWQFSIRPAVPEYCRATPTDFVALLEEPRLVDDQHAVGIAKVLTQIADQFIADGIGIPDGSTQKMLDGERVGVAEAFGHLPAVLAFDIAEQSSQIIHRSLTRFDAGKVTGDPFADSIEFTQPNPEAWQPCSRPDMKNPRQCSVARANSINYSCRTRKTPICQFSIRPAMPLYCRASPTDLSPFFRKPVSSTTGPWDRRGAYGRNAVVRRGPCRGCC